jgi:REP element-mobilizing transposase RayT
MSSRNVLKVDVAESYYHIYARGASRQPIFYDHDDYTYFLSLLHRYLSKDIVKNSIGIAYDKLIDDIELLSYCLMQNHFHLLVYQVNEGAMPRLMRGVMTSYSRYFNKKYQRSGSLFETRYKASRISSDTYLMHISRYIHLNPRQWRSYVYSSLPYYSEKAANTEDWLKPEKILSLFSSRQEYMQFVEDYKDLHDLYENLKHELAN